MTDGSLGMSRIFFLLVRTQGCRVFIYFVGVFFSPTAGVRLLPLIGPNGLKRHVEVCLVKLQMRPFGLCLPLAGERDCEVLSWVGWVKNK